MENRHIKILAIDDHQDNLISLNALIKEAFPHAVILTALNGISGIELAAAEDPDVILLDIVMPGMDGFEVCTKLKADKTLRDIPVVFVTAIKGDKEHRTRALEVGAEAFLAKPIDESELTAGIRAMVKIKKAHTDKRDENKRLAALVEARTRELEESHTAALNLLAEREKLQDQLLQAQKMESIGSLAGGIAHDFNNILFPIVGLSELLLEDLSPDSLGYQNAEEILKAGKRGSHLVQQILSFSRQSEHQFIPVEIQQILKEALKLCRSAIPADIEISRDIQKDCGQVMADPTQIHQIAMNLITNAYHAVEPGGGKISVVLKEIVLDGSHEFAETYEPGRYVLLTVSDTGTGIDPAVMNKIFDPYFTTKEKGRGTGLGLATVYGIVKKHGGSIKVYSEVGKGSIFSIYLPVSEKSGTVDAEKKGFPLPTGTEHVLLVDDERVIVQLEKQMLEKLGYPITCFTGSVDALSAFKADPSHFDLVMTDMNMPDLTGLQLAEALSLIRPDIPIIVCTGFSERINRKKAHAMGIRGFLMKPVLMSEMAQMVRKVLDEAGPKSEMNL